METALGWIGELVRWMAAWIPRIIHVDVRYRGVRFVRGRLPALVEPGLRVFWPITTALIVWPANLQILRLRSQSLRTRDRVLVELEIVVAYTIGDIVVLFSELFDPDSAIGDYCLGAARQVVCSSTLAELEQDYAATDQALVTEIRKLVHPLGVRVKRARFVSLAPARALKLFGVTAKSDVLAPVQEA